MSDSAIQKLAMIELEIRRAASLLPYDDYDRNALEDKADAIQWACEIALSKDDGALHENPLFRKRFMTPFGLPLPNSDEDARGGAA